MSWDQIAVKWAAMVERVHPNALDPSPPPPTAKAPAAPLPEPVKETEA